MSVVKVTLTHSSSQKIVPEKRLLLTQTIESIKQNAYTHFATPVDCCRLELFDDEGAKVESEMRDDKMLGYYQCKNGYRIHVVDLQPAPQQNDYDDVSQVEKYSMSEHDYLKRDNNLRAFKQRMLEQQQAEMRARGIEPPPALDENSFEQEASAIHVGDRCECRPGDRLGTVRYVGRLAALKPGYWIGVEFDEPVGKSDGTVKGVRVFTCNQNYGGFLRPSEVTIGDFPPEEY